MKLLDKLRSLRNKKKRGTKTYHTKAEAISVASMRAILEGLEQAWRKVPIPAGLTANQVPTLVEARRKWVEYKKKLTARLRSGNA